MITNLVILAFIVGLLSGAVLLGAITWFKSPGFNLKWWKWLLSVVWYVLLLFLVFAAFTFMGEGETAAGWKSLGAGIVILVILGAGLVQVLRAK